jgi:hypothetical protein
MSKYIIAEGKIKKEGEDCSEMKMRNKDIVSKIMKNMKEYMVFSEGYE